MSVVVGEVVGEEEETVKFGRWAMVVVVGCLRCCGWRFGVEWVVLVFDLERGEFLMCLSVKMRQTRARAALVYIVKSTQVRSGQVRSGYLC